MDASFFQVLQLFGMFTEKLASSVQTTGECDNMLPTKVSQRGFWCSNYFDLRNVCNLHLESANLKISTRNSFQM